MNRVVATCIDWLARTLTTLKRTQKTSILLLVDVVLPPLCFWVMFLITAPDFRSTVTASTLSMIVLVAILALVGGLSSALMGLPRIKLNAYEQSGIQRTAGYSSLVGLSAVVVLHLIHGASGHASQILVFTMILLIVSVGVRLAMRSILIGLYQRGQKRQRVLIYGAGRTGVQLASALQTDDAVVPVAFLDDNKTLHGVTVGGLTVLSPIKIEALLKDLQIDRIVVAMPSLSRPQQVRLVSRLQAINCEVSILPSFAVMVSEGKLVDRIQPVNPSQFLGREGLEDELTERCDIYAGRTVMITGGGGSIGSELARQIVACKPSRIVLFENNEFALYQLDHELADLQVDQLGIEVCSALGSITDAGTVERTISRFGVEIILHAAAYKHVPLVEDNTLVALHNNVIGTKIVAEAALKANVAHFILVSTDKAVHPTSVMGASKRLSELLVQDLATRSSQTGFGIVRFGNVLGSSGSVVPLFQEQIARGGPVTLTHHEVSRYFMTLSEAARLVLLAGNYTLQGDRNGDVFLLDMGKPVLIQKLARQMIEAAGYTVRDASNPQGDIEIIITGLRPGEKIHEELRMRNHEQWPTSHPKISRLWEERLSQIEMATALKGLTRVIAENDEAGAMDVIQRWVGLSSRPRRPKRDVHSVPVVHD